MKPDDPICGSPKNRKSKSPEKLFVVKVYDADQAEPSAAPTWYVYEVFGSRAEMVAWALM